MVIYFIYIQRWTYIYHPYWPVVLDWSLGGGGLIPASHTSPLFQQILMFLLLKSGRIQNMTIKAEMGGVFLCNEPLLHIVYGRSKVAFSYFPAIIYRGNNDCCKLDPTINSPFLYTTKNGCFCDLHQEKAYFSRESDRFTQSTPLIK